MVAVIRTGYSLPQAIYYNEQKVGDGKAVCIAAGNYPLDVAQMDRSIRLGYLAQRVSLSTRAQRVSMHISLNFSPEDPALSEDKLVAIAERYMQGIGFGKQPYLVYRHDDAAHPHMHIVTTTVRPDGKAINTFLIGKLKSEPVREEIERAYGLVRAQDRQKSKDFGIAPASVPQAEYGIRETRKTIQQIVGKVIEKYRFSSLAEFNAVLGKYNVMADPGLLGSRISAHRGLVYRILDNEGKPCGVSIKASNIYGSPTLRSLQKLFDRNKDKSASEKSRLRSVIDHALLGQRSNMTTLAGELSSRGIDMVLRKNDAGFIYGLTFIDHRSGVVVNGSDLGKRYSAKGIQQRCIESQLSAKGIDLSVLKVPDKKAMQGSEDSSPTHQVFAQDSESSLVSELLDCLLRVEQGSEYIPYELQQRSNFKRKKRSRSVKR